MAQIPTVTIKDGDGVKNINLSEYDPKKHQLADEKPKAKK